MEIAVHLKVIQPLSWILSHLSGLYPIWIYFGYDKNVEEHQQKKVRLSMSTLTDCTFLLIDIIQLHLPMLHFILRKKHVFSACFFLGIKPSTSIAFVHIIIHFLLNLPQFLCFCFFLKFFLCQKSRF